MNWALARSDAIDVERIDPHQDRAGLDQPLRQGRRKVRVSVKILVRSPMLIPACVHQNGTSGDLIGCQGKSIDGARSTGWRPCHDAVEVCEAF